MTSSDGSDVSIDLETFELSQGKPAIQLGAAVRRWPVDPPELARPELLGNAWMWVAVSGFSAGERVMLTAEELLDFGALCTRFGEALLQRRRDAGL